MGPKNCANWKDKKLHEDGGEEQHIICMVEDAVKSCMDIIHKLQDVDCGMQDAQIPYLGDVLMQYILVYGFVPCQMAFQLPDKRRVLMI